MVECNKTEARHAKGQPVLVGTRTVANSEDIAALLLASGFRFRLLNAKQDADEAEIIAQAVQKKIIQDFCFFIYILISEKT